MSIEAMLQAHIDALKENTAAVLLLEASLVGRASGKPKEELAKEEKPKAEPAKVKQEKAAEAASTAEAQESIDREQDAQVDAEIPASVTSYETLRELVLKLASGGKRDEIKAVSKTHGLGAPKDLLDPKDGVTVMDQAKLEAVYADLLALEA